MTETTETTATDAVDFIRQQHEQIRSLFATVEQADGEARQQPFECLLRLLAVHETAEEIVIYPVLRRSGPEGARIADERTAEEDQSKKLLSDLEKIEVTSPEFLTRFGEVKALVLPHAEREEQTVLPLLQEVRDEDERRKMASALKAAQAMAPTHPHPHAPESAIGNLVLGPFVAMVDRVRDALREAMR